MDKSLRLVFILALLPLVVGGVISLLWRSTHWPDLLPIGLLATGAAAICVLVALAMIIEYTVRSLHGPRDDRWAALSSTVLTLAMLLTSCPVTWAVLSSVTANLRPTVPLDWVKARVYEFQRLGPRGVRWPHLVEDCWYFLQERFGVRVFRPETAERILVFAPDGDGPRAWVLLPDGSLRSSFDDAASLGCEWLVVKDAPATEFVTTRFEMWPDADWR